LIEQLLLHEQQLRREAMRLKKQLEREHEELVDWSCKLAQLHEVSLTLLKMVGQTTLSAELLQAGIDALPKLLKSRYAAVLILDSNGKLMEFAYSGMSAEEAEAIGQLPQGIGLTGVVIRENKALRLNDLRSHPDSVGFPPEHPEMRSLLAVPISGARQVYGRIYICDKFNDTAFTALDEELAQSFAHSLGLLLDNQQQQQQIKLSEFRIDYMSHHDIMTGLPNRAALAGHLEQALSIARRHRKKVAVLFLGVDDFSRVNNTFGDYHGDELIKTLATRVTDCLREEDTCARWEGDQFAVLLPEISHESDVIQVAEKIWHALKLPLSVAEMEITCSISIGASLYPDSAEDVKQLLTAAHTAMDFARKVGKNSYKLFSNDMAWIAQEHLRLESELRNALKNGEFRLFYQPQIDLVTRSVSGMEALLRWRHPSNEIVTPDKFIAVAEESGLIVEIGAWVLRSACVQASQWLQQGLRARVSVNVSARQFHSRDIPLLDLVRQCLTETGLTPEALELEITESLLMDEEGEVKTILLALREMGVRLAVDDFGTGYSSLNYLRNFPINVLKIDKSFVQNLETNENDRAIVRAICALAGALRIGIIAEGVENEQQESFLRAHSCFWIQGYLYARPMPAHEAEIFAHQFSQSPGADSGAELDIVIDSNATAQS